MDSLQTLAVIIFWTSACLAVYAYLGYPLLVSILARVFGKKARPAEVADEELPSVSQLICAYNEDAVIAERIETALATDYPAERFEIVVASDGSSDRTAEIVKRYAARGVRLLDYKERRGKAEVLNASVPELSGDIVLLSDANTEIEPAATRKLARWFADDAVGAVCGRLVLHDVRTSRNVDGLYWRYENHLKRCDASLGGLLGANGAIYALRKDLFRPVPRGTIIDDFVIPLQAKLDSGCRIIYDCEAVAHEETAVDVRSEFRRRSRIGAGGCQCIGLLWPLLNPAHGWVAFTFFSHKICRWLCPIAMLGLLLCNLALLERPLYQVTMATQAMFYLGAGLASYLPGRSPAVRLLRLSSMFVGMNAALLVGIYRWLAGRQKGTWNRTVRTAEIAAAAASNASKLSVVRIKAHQQDMLDVSMDEELSQNLSDSSPDMAPVGASSAVNS
ncbi:MAG TPA: glycosyltransferase family 2 protein [Gemmataceae bacterium]|jgi:cellulose synthase/poly-beta-1,6-N-acetylglucosamine synthase-like glycosyltransferase|nr:glycosyltransferase family 2 protein [Gemmataceae bacterium]